MLKPGDSPKFAFKINEASYWITFVIAFTRMVGKLQQISRARRTRWFINIALGVLTRSSMARVMVKTALIEDSCDAAPEFRATLDARTSTCFSRFGGWGDSGKAYVR